MACDHDPISSSVYRPPVRRPVHVELDQNQPLRFVDLADRRGSIRTDRDQQRYQNSEEFDPLTHAQDSRSTTVG